jgi:hypothetical protein
MAKTPQHHKVVVKLNQIGLGEVTVDGTTLNARSIKIESSARQFTHVSLELTLCEVEVEVEGSVNVDPNERDHLQYLLDKVKDDPLKIKYVISSIEALED